MTVAAPVLIFVFGKLEREKNCCKCELFFFAKTLYIETAAADARMTKYTVCRRMNLNKKTEIRGRFVSH